MQVIEGFESIYYYIMNHKRLVINAIYKHFNGSLVRFYPRIYQSYSYTIKKSIFPKYLKSGEERVAVIMKGIDSRSVIDTTIPEEFKRFELIQLMINSIPKFHIDYIEGTIKELRDISSDDYHLEAPIDILKARINRFSKQDLEEQKKLIRKSFNDYKANLNKYEMGSFYV